jgi:hypothetical protein
MNFKLKNFLINRDTLMIEKKTNALQGQGNTKNMNEFRINEQMELLLTAKLNKPDLYAKLPAATKMSVGIYENDKQNSVVIGLTGDEHLRLRGLKLSVAHDNLPPSERISKSLEIQNLENRIGDK